MLINNVRLLEYDKLKDYASGIAYCNELLSCFPENSYLLYTRGVWRLNLNDLSGSLSDLEKVVAKGSGDWVGWAYLQIGEVYLRLGDNRKALLYTEMARDLMPEDAYVYNKLGMVFYSMGEKQRALEQFVKSLAKLERNEFAYLNASRCCFDLGKFKHTVWFAKDGLKCTTDDNIKRELEGIIELVSRKFLHF